MGVSSYFKEMIQGMYDAKIDRKLHRVLGVRIGATLEDVWRNNFFNFKRPFPLPFTIPEGLTVKDQEGNLYVTGREEHNWAQDISGVFLHRVSPARSQTTWIQPLLFPDDLRPFTIVSYDRDAMKKCLNHLPSYFDRLCNQG